MCRPKMLYSLVVAGLLAFSSVAHAAVYGFDYGKLLTGSAGVPGNFAYLYFSTIAFVN